MTEILDTLTEKQLSAALHCSKAALRRMRREGRGPRWTRVGRLIRYPKQWIQQFIEQNASSAAGTPERCLHTSPPHFGARLCFIPMGAISILWQFFQLDSTSTRKRIAEANSPVCSVRNQQSFKQTPTGLAYTVPPLGSKTAVQNANRALRQFME
jgi:Helix-turn-helix domain